MQQPPNMIPEGLTALVALGITYLVTQGLKAISRVLGRDISGKASVVSAIIIQCLLLTANSIIADLPPETRGTVSAVMTAILLVLGAAGVHSTIKTVSVARDKPDAV